MKVLIRQNVSYGTPGRPGGLLLAGETHEIPDDVAARWIGLWIADDDAHRRGPKPIKLARNVPPVRFAPPKVRP